MRQLADPGWPTARPFPTNKRAKAGLFVNQGGVASTAMLNLRWSLGNEARVLYLKIR